MAGAKLIADIGGTNARFAIAADGDYAHLQVLHTGAHPTLTEAARIYLAGLPDGITPARGAFCIAGPVSGDRVQMTNSPWSFSIAAVQAALNLADLVVVNDFAATAMAIPFLRPNDTLAVGGGAAAPGGPIGIIGPGTGLGVGALVPSRDGWINLPGEGGHVTMAAVTDEEARVLDRLRAAFDHVSAERVLSGQGLENLHGALCRIGGAAARGLSASEITAAALAGSDPICSHALDMFCAMLGTAAGNMALTLGATGGVYVAGGIVPRFEAHFAGSAFRSRFEAKGRMAAYLRPIPTFLIRHHDPALVGLTNLP